MSDQIPLLLVDDETALLEELCDFLSWNGVRVTTAGDGQEALTKLAADQAITVVLTDIRMPLMTGLSLTSQIMQARTDADAVEVVLMTGHGNVDNAAQAVRAGAFDYLRKPMALAETLTVVRRAHAKAVGRRATQAAREAELARLRADFAALQARMSASGPQLDLSRESPPEVARILSHELRTPLIPLMALPDLLGEGENLPPGLLNECLQDVQTAGKRLTEIADDLIELLAAPPAPKTPMPAVAAQKVLENLLADFAPAFAHAGVKLTLGPVASGSVQTDLATLTRALGRLLGNALAACRAKGGHVELAAVAQDGGGMAIEVRDSSHGMNEAELTRAQLPFQQVDMSLTRSSGGLGLGLPLASRAARRLGGKLVIQSIPGEGTVAGIVLPGEGGNPLQKA